MGCAAGAGGSGCGVGHGAAVGTCVGTAGWVGATVGAGAGVSVGSGVGVMGEGAGGWAVAAAATTCVADPSHACRSSGAANTPMSMTSTHNASRPPPHPRTTVRTLLRLAAPVTCMRPSCRDCPHESPHSPMAAADFQAERGGLVRRPLGPG